MRIIDDKGSNIDKAWVQFSYCDHTIAVSNHPPEITVLDPEGHPTKDFNGSLITFEASIDGIIEARDLVDQLTGNDHADAEEFSDAGIR